MSGGCKGLCKNEKRKYCNKPLYDRGYGQCSVCERAIFPNPSNQCYCCNRFLRRRPVILSPKWK